MSAYYEDMVVSACRQTDLAGLQALCGPDAPALGLEARQHAFWNLCAFGALEAAQWFAERYALTADDVRVANNAPLRAACSHGHLALAQWMVGHFGLTAADAFADDASGFLFACADGHLATAQWFAGAFGVTAEMAKARGDFALQMAEGYGHAAVAEWLLVTYYAGQRPPADGPRWQALKVVDLRTPRETG